MDKTISGLLENSFENKKLPESIQKFIHQIIGNRNPVGIIYYGSSLWKNDLTGLLDFYIVCDNLYDWNDGFLSAFANQCLPPNIEYHEFLDGQISLKAKVAIISLKQLKKATSLSSLDTTMWARFCQPVKIIWWRSLHEKKQLLDCLVQAVKTAVYWAVYLGPSKGYAEDYWIALFRETYQAELRVENKNRPILILENREEYFRDLLQAGWKELHIPFTTLENGLLLPELPSKDKNKAESQWKWRVKLGRPLNILRLIKAAFTFKGGAEYIAWKIKRHQSIDLQLTAFQKKHPLLSAPWIFVKLYRQGVFTR